MSAANVGHAWAEAWPARSVLGEYSQGPAREIACTAWANVADGGVVFAEAEAPATANLAVDGAARATSWPSCHYCGRRRLAEVLGGANNRNESGLAVVRDDSRHQSGMS